MRVRIGLKIFSIAAGLLILMGAAALLSLRMTRTIDAQLVVIDQNYFPAFVALAEANINSLREATLFRRMLLDSTDGMSPQHVDEMRERVAEAGRESDQSLVAARKSINEQITDWLDFDDNVALARLDTNVEFLQEARQDYEKLLAAIRTAFDAGHTEEVNQLLREFGISGDRFGARMDAARAAMREIASNAILGTRAYQQKVIDISLALLLIAAALGLIVAAAVTTGLVRPVRRLLHAPRRSRRARSIPSSRSRRMTRSASLRNHSTRWSASCGPRRKFATPSESISTRAS